MNVVCEYTSGSANNVSKAVALVPEYNEIVYAVCNLVVIVDATTQSVVETLKSHHTSVSSVTSLRRSRGTSSSAVELITCSDDGHVCVWRKRESTEHYTLEQRLEDMRNAVVALDAVALSSGGLITACDSSGYVFMWYSPAEGPYRVVYSKSSQPSQMPNCLCAIPIPALEGSGSDIVESFLLALGGVDCRIVIKIFYAGDICNAFNSADRIDIPDRVAGVLSGHEDWVTCLSSALVHDELMLASGSQDSKIRLWRLSRCTGPSVKALVVGSDGVSAADIQASSDTEDDDDITAEGEQAPVSTEADFTGNDEARFSFSVNDGHFWYSAFLEALLVGHEDWVTSVHWVQTGGPGGSWKLFSTSMDRNMLLWESEAGGVWIPMVRIGDIGGNLGGSVGANLLGFVNGVITQTGNSIIGIGYGGAFHLWHRSEEDAKNRNEASSSASEQWVPKPFPTGHFGPVTDISWSPDGSYLLSVSSDQTCRLHARVNQKYQPRMQFFDCQSPPKSSKYCWREVSRPQVHGYDLTSIACSPSVPNLFFSGGDEKVIRVFEASQAVLDGLSTLCVGCEGGPIAVPADPERIQRAFIPALGLSNKAASLMSTNEVEEQESRHVELMDWTEPPLEGQLSDHTLWPETRKLFGHTGDIMCVAISHSGSILATACKGRNPETSSIILWSTTTMSQLGLIRSHESTVVCIRFSPNDEYLMSVSKDRGLCISERSVDTEIYHPVILHKNAHKRIIWDCSWCCDKEILTGSRDGVCKLWALSSGPDAGFTLEHLFEFRPFDGIAVTTLDVVTNRLKDGTFLLATGSESGDIKVWSVKDRSVNSAEAVSVTLLSTVDTSNSHGITVKRLRWNPCQVVACTHESSENSANHFQFASCGEDKCVRVFTANFS